MNKIGVGVGENKRVIRKKEEVEKLMKEIRETGTRRSGISITATIELGVKQSESWEDRLDVDQARSTLSAEIAQKELIDAVLKLEVITEATGIDHWAEVNVYKVSPTSPYARLHPWTRGADPVPARSEGDADQAST